MRFYKKSIIPRQGQPYLIRYNLFECRLFSIKVHHILRSDDDCLHDHPWAFVTFLLRGGYRETTYSNIKRWTVVNGHTTDHGYFKATKYYPRFSLLYRPATYVHRLDVDSPVWTLVISFKKTREWGFHTPKEWIPWYRYDDSKNLCE